MNVPVIIFVFACIFSFSLCDGSCNHHKNHQTSRHHHNDARALLPDLQESTATCGKICIENSNWAMQTGDMHIVYNQNASALALINVKTQAAIILAKQFMRMAFVYLNNGQTVIVDQKGMAATGNVNEATTLLTTPNSPSVLLKYSQLIENAVYSEAPPTGWNTTICTLVHQDLPMAIITATKKLMCNLAGTPTGLFDGSQLFSYFFNLYSLLQGVQSNQITKITVDRDNSISAYKSSTLLFSISPSGKIIQNGKVLGTMASTQSQVLPGGVSVTSSQNLKISFSGQVSTPKNILSPLVQGVGSLLGINGITNPVNNLLDNFWGGLGLGQM